ncbi:hypothetical protein B9Z55_014398 [Caenorhabditis nigoni]|uniref:Fatty acid desaturase domain-containing protein n=1 Tax=Caenorhabditis nigoni TaxID=1611254 RepID=A0A2G5U693_9PELO|nr:hypothetical protein B9Z55_014398 [Caenorhabditis nigoni]
MVLREQEHEPFYIKIDGKWCQIDDAVLRAHPGGSAITTYKNMDATTVFHTFHTGSKEAYKWLTELKRDCPTQDPDIPDFKEDLIKGIDDVNMGSFNISDQRSAQINKNFDSLRMRVRAEGLMNGSPLFYTRKILETIFTILLAFYLQYNTYYFTAAVLMGIAWQQLGWLIHEFAHHQLFKNRYYNDLASYFVGNFLQGFSSGGWKEQHNVHHAATNVVGRDGDLDLVPFYATVAEHLNNYSQDSWIMILFRWQHVHWAFMLPFLRLSWLLQSIIFVSQMPTHYYDYYRKTAIYEQVGLSLHWAWSLGQLYFLPDWSTRIMFFFVSHLVGGFLLAHVVTFNHYSVEKFALSSNIMSNYACLQIMTTRNMRPGRFIDWLWGGLNYQIEHHLFPTMPRHNLNAVMPLVKEFAADNGLPYMVDDYFTGFWLEIEQFRNIANVAAKLTKKIA